MCYFFVILVSNLLYQISTCTGFAALLANNKYTKGYATTGVVATVDARHGFLLPNGIGDLQKAERYVLLVIGT